MNDYEPRGHTQGLLHHAGGFMEVPCPLMRMENFA